MLTLLLSALVLCFVLVLILSKRPFWEMLQDRQNLNWIALGLFTVTIIIEYLHHLEGLYLLGFKSNVIWKAVAAFCVALILMSNVSDKEVSALKQIILLLASCFLMLLGLISLLFINNGEQIYEDENYRIETAEFLFISRGKGDNCYYLAKKELLYETMYRMQVPNGKVRGGNYIDPLDGKTVRIEEKDNAVVVVYFIGATIDTVIVYTK